MGHDKYYKIKHRIDFYLEEAGITDLSEYRLGRPASTGITINIEHWGYTTVTKPTNQVLKQLVNRPNFKAHMYKNMLIHKQDVETGSFIFSSDLRSHDSQLTLHK